MAWVLVAVGALMAAAGLYVIGYSALNSRFEEYWASMTAGTTLVAGGVVTVAIGFATRALRDLGTALSTQPLALTTGAPATMAPPGPLPAIEPEHPPEPQADAPHELQPSLPLLHEPEAHPQVEPPVSAHAVESSEAGTPPSVAAAYDPPFAPPAALPHDLATPAEPLPPRPEDPRKTEIADAARAESDVKPEPPKPPLPTSSAITPRPSEPHQMPDDWLERAFADLDQELPIGIPAPRSPLATPYQPDVPVRTSGPAMQTTPSPEPVHVPAPAMAAAPSAIAPPTMEEPAPPPPLAPDPPSSAVIGRYEADGTSYVMYADGSIEAQSSAGVYRFSSMAELKSFIES